MEKRPEPRDERVRPAVVRRISSRELFASADRIEIEHRGATYRLQITRQGKLILTK